MLKVKIIKTAFAVLLTVLLGAHAWVGLSIWWAVLLFFAYVVTMAYGALSIQSGFFLPILCSAKTSQKKIALTFDDGPDPEVTPALLDLLKKHDIQAGFFCIGKEVTEHKELLQRMDREGHVIGNHTYSHSKFIDTYGFSRMKEELQGTEEVIENAIHKKVKLFRPPYGATNPQIRKAVIALNYITIGWNVRSLDTVISDNNKVIARVTSRLAPGSIVLLHDTDKKVLEIVRGIIRYASENGITIVAPDKLLNIEPYEYPTH